MIPIKTGNAVEEVQYYHAGTFSEAAALEAGTREETSQDTSKARTNQNSTKNC